jgi:hypothetical protein
MTDDTTYRIGDRVIRAETGITGIITARRTNPLGTNYLVDGVEYRAEQLRPIPARMANA